MNTSKKIQLLPLATKIILTIFFVFTSCKSVKPITQENLYPSNSISIPFHNDWAKEHYPLRINEFKKNPLQNGDIIMLGNSITQSGGNWAEKIGNNTIKNRGVTGDITDGVLERLNEIIFFKPKKIFILIGINDIDNLCQQKGIPSTDYIINNIVKITNTIHKGSPNTKIYLQTILPTTDPVLNKHIVTINKYIKEHVTKYPYQVINLYKHFIDSNNLLREDLKRPSKKDRLHLNEKGYIIWANVLKPFIL